MPKRNWCMDTQQTNGLWMCFSAIKLPYSGSKLCLAVANGQPLQQVRDLSKCEMDPGVAIADYCPSHKSVHSASKEWVSHRLDGDEDATMSVLPTTGTSNGRVAALTLLLLLLLSAF